MRKREKQKRQRCRAATLRTRLKEAGYKPLLVWTRPGDEKFLRRHAQKHGLNWFQPAAILARPEPVADTTSNQTTHPEEQLDFLSDDQPTTT